MTGREFSGVDIDLLADYVGGALDGNPDEAVVAALVATDPAWREAHDVLTVGMASVGAELRALGAEPAAMPDDLAARLTAAFAGLAESTSPAAGSPESTSPAAGSQGSAGSREPTLDVRSAAGDSTAGGTEHPGRRHLSAVPGQGDKPAATSGRAADGGRRGLRRWAAPIAVAAGVLAFAGVGLEHLLSAGHNTGTDSTTAGAYRAERGAPMLASEGAEPEATYGQQGAGPDGTRPGRLAAAPAADRILASGVDYGRGSFSRRAEVLDRSVPTLREAPAPAAGEVIDESSAGPGLRRLSEREALLACLEAIARENNGGSASISAVDYARFEGGPALVVQFTADNGDWVWAVGPDCGLPGTGADTRHRVRVG